MLLNPVGLSCFLCGFLPVLANVNTPFLGTFLDTPVTTRSNMMATTEKQNNLRTTLILPQAESEKTTGFCSLQV